MDQMNYVCLWDIRSGEQIQVFNGHKNYVWSVEYSPFVIKNSIGNSNVICSGSLDNTIRFWDIRSNNNELYIIKGNEKENNKILCLKFIRLKKKGNTKNVTYNLNLCYALEYVFYFALLFKKLKKLNLMFFKELKSILMNIVFKYQNKLQGISSIVFFV
ncbi:hypothetical protein RFI_15441 [Reticulomyxa filosa]|uniref:Uncharacterized protein n=1 Tax=Reticulomyxa filosa TaxID=46433 RepID=X6N8Y7_RETFI|nr:hypothetical protein RFI_15441 [Reticulomyxa filosa]|eukprot:ETO21762.1 hypothetical protein RFI_15441 [Reticulomyxa filosa]